MVKNGEQFMVNLVEKFGFSPPSSDYFRGLTFCLILSDQSVCFYIVIHLWRLPYMHRCKLQLPTFIDPTCDLEEPHSFPNSTS